MLIKKINEDTWLDEINWIILKNPKITESVSTVQ